MVVLYLFFPAVRESPVVLALCSAVIFVLVSIGRPLLICANVRKWAFRLCLYFRGQSPHAPGGKAQNKFSAAKVSRRAEREEFVAALAASSRTHDDAAKSLSAAVRFSQLPSISPSPNRKSTNSHLP